MYSIINGLGAQLKIMTDRIVHALQKLCCHNSFLGTKELVLYKEKCDNLNIEDREVVLSFSYK